MLVFVGALLLFGAALWWLHEPIPLRLSPGSQVVDLEIEPGTSASGVADAVVASGADVPMPVSYTHLTLPTIYSV